MATISWPSDLPDNLLVKGYEEQPPDTSIRTEMEEGPDKVRRWGTADVRPINGQQWMTDSQVSSLDTFYRSTSKSGALRFDWTHPRTGNSVEFRFTGPPSYTPLGGGNWRVKLELEIMP